MDDTVKLLPCPFCGFEAEAFHAFPKAEEGWVIEAEHDETCPLVGFVGERQCYASADIAALAWNARVPTAWNTRAALSASPEDGWQDIATARKDGTRVLLWAEKWQASHCGCFDGMAWTIGYDLPPFLYEPTHWRPLPAPPQGRQQ